MSAYDPHAFPPPFAPPLPVPSRRSFAWRTGPAPTGVLQAGQVIRTHSGRYAIALALAHAGLVPGDRVLLPAYHCLAMVEPIRTAGLVPVYYPLRPDTTLAPQVLARLGTSGARALLVVHYFGFVQDLEDVQQVAKRLGMVLIEDCAHACFGQFAGRPVGSRGDYAVASTLKFLPLGDGGLLASAHRDLSNLRLRPPPLMVELKAAVNLLEQALAYRRLGRAAPALAGLVRLKERVLGGLKRIGSGRHERPGTAITALPEPIPEHRMDRRWLTWSGTRVGTLLLRRARTDDLVQRRRAHYLAYLQAVAGRTDCRPLFATLPADTVPQVFPLYVNQCLAVFLTLKHQGVPIIRFGEVLDPAVTPALCPVSVDYAAHVLQFPCHQELSASEVEWILERLVAALNGAAPR